jgi:hypothetical protein
VGSYPRPAAKWRTSVLHAIESNSRQARLRHVRREPVPAILRRRDRPPRAPARALFPVAVDRLLRRPGCGRAIAWRAADSFALREFVELVLPEASPDHSTISRTRRLIDVETHKAVFTWTLRRLADAGLVKGKTVGIDATTLEANAALRSIVRRDTGESYDDFLTKLAQASGIEDAGAGGPGAPRSKAEEERLERRLDASARPRRQDHQDEGRPHASRPQSRACGRSGDGRCRWRDRAGRR